MAEIKIQFINPNTNEVTARYLSKLFASVIAEQIVQAEIEAKEKPHRGHQAIKPSKAGGGAK